MDLYWLPLGAGGHFVRLNGRAYEAVAARLQRRPACDLYHSALQVEIPGATYVIEQAPVHDWSGKDRGVVAEGAVGTLWAGRFRIFRYWGRDELATGEMWNSNSVIAWTLARSGIDTEPVQPPAGTGAWLASRTRGCAQARQSGERDRRAFAPALSESIDS